MVVACFDIGGTGIKAGLIGSDKQINYRQEWKTPSSLEGLLALMDSVIQRVDGLAAISSVSLEQWILKQVSSRG